MEKFKFRISLFLLFAMLVLLIGSCNKKDDSTSSGAVPVLTTNSCSSITQTTAKCGGNVTSDGGSIITARGVCWSKNQNPTIVDNKTTDNMGAGEFTSNITGLLTNTSYYVRAYATNSAGTGYGSTMFFTTLQANGAMVADVDGNVYYAVAIGTQVWLVENLMTTKYRDGTSIPNITDNTAWNNLTSGSYCDYENSPSNSQLYGRLYNYFTVSDNHNLCPVGWHVPSDAEWTTLAAYLGGDDLAGGKIKETDVTHWQTPNEGATNESGFTALPSGYRAITGQYSLKGANCFLWSSTESNSTNAWHRLLYYNESRAGRFEGNMNSGFSVRCIKD